MPIDPNIALRGRVPDIGGTIGRGVQLIQAKKRQEAADKKASALLELKRQEEARVQQEQDRKDVARNVAIKGKEIIGVMASPTEDPRKALELIDENIQRGGKDVAAWADLRRTYQQDPAQAKTMLERVIGQARFEKLIPDIKGKRVNAQIPGQEGIISAIESPEGYLLDPSTGKRMPKAIKAPTRQAVGKPGEFTTKTRGEIEERILTTGEGISRLEDISRTYKPEFQQVGTRMSAAFAAGKEKAGMEINVKERKNLEDFTKFKRRAADNLNRTIKDITGAAMSIPEARRITRAAPNPGTGIFDGDSPTVFKSKLDDATETLKAANRRLLDLRKKGFTGNVTEDVAERFPLSDYKVSTDQSVLDEAQDAINRGADPDMVKQRLQEMDIDPARLK